MPAGSPLSPERFVRRGREVRGPFTTDQLRELARHRKIRPDDRVRQGRDGAWCDAASVPGLFAAPNALPPGPAALTEPAVRTPPAAAQGAPSAPCPNCGNQVQVPAAFLGRTICPFCGSQWGGSPHGATAPTAAVAASPVPTAYALHPVAQEVPRVVFVQSPPAPPQLPYVPNEKSSGIAVLLAFFYPGLGQIYNGPLIAFVLLFVGGTLALWVWGMVDAYSTAEEINRRNRRRYGHRS